MLDEYQLQQVQAQPSSSPPSAAALMANTLKSTTAATVATMSSHSSLNRQSRHLPSTLRANCSSVTNTQTRTWAPRRSCSISIPLRRSSPRATSTPRARSCPGIACPAQIRLRLSSKFAPACRRRGAGWCWEVSLSEAVRRSRSWQLVCEVPDSKCCREEVLA